MVFTWNGTIPVTRTERLRRLWRAVVWRRLDQPGAEYCELWEAADGWDLRGSVVLAHEGVPVFAQYIVTCDSRWSTRQAQVTLARGGVEQRVTLRADSDQRWWQDGEEVQELRGCVDVDQGFTPATNTLPIRRLELAVGESREVTAAWVRLPSLTVELLPQRYTRLAARRFRYESRGGQFTTELETDELGLVARYPPAWEREAETSV